MANALTNEEVERSLPSGWRRDGKTIVRQYEFDTYLDGVTFANVVAEVAEEQQHHPTITITYDSVSVRFTTHEVDGITKRDLRAAGLCNDEY